MTAIFPLPKIPTVVILRNGELKEYLAAGTSKDDFSRRVQSALDASATAPPQDQQPPSGGSPADAAAPAAANTATPPTAPSPAPAPASSAADSTPAEANPPVPAQSTTGSESSGVQAMMAERAARLDQQREEAKKKALEAYAKAKAKGKEKADPDSDDKNKSKKPGQNEFADSVRKQQREAADERKRILKRIEDDKVARKDMATAKTRQGSSSTATSSEPSTRVGRSGEKAAILVRLYDGSTLRNRFAKASSVRGDIRSWVDSNRKDGSTSPYRFRVALDPTTSRVIDDTEEDRTLEELGLAPSATLVLVPIPNFVTANAGGGVVQRTTSLFLWFYTMISTFFTSLLGRGATNRSEEIEMDELNRQDGDGTERGKSSASGVNTLQDSARQRRDHQFYNGNSVSGFPNTEPPDTYVLTNRS